MARTQYYCATSLDGYIADPDDGLDWLTGYEGSYAGPDAQPGPIGEGGSYDAFYDGVGALVSGSATYEFVLEHAASWPYAGKPYWVLSSRELPRPDGDDVDVRVVAGTIPELGEELIGSAGEGSLWIVGGGGVASDFADAGLLDELLLTVVPVVLGAGKPLFARALPGGALRLAGTTAFTSGMVELRYEAGDPAPGRVAADSDLEPSQR